MEVIKHAQTNVVSMCLHVRQYVRSNCECVTLPVSIQGMSHACVSCPHAVCVCVQAYTRVGESDNTPIWSDTTHSSG